MSNRIVSKPILSAADRLLQKNRASLIDGGVALKRRREQHDPFDREDEASDSSVSSTESLSSSSSLSSRETAGGKSSKKKKSKKKEKEEKKKKNKKKNKEKKQKKKSKKKQKTLAACTRWGEYGLIYSDSFIEKQREFAQWCREVHGRDPDVMPRGEQLELFKSFCEDHNTCSFPHKKFYDLTAWELKVDRKKKKRAEKARQRMIDAGAVDLRADEAAIKSARR